VYVIRLADRFTADDRNEILRRLRGAGIGCSNYFAPVHLMSYIRESLGTAEGDFPVTERIAERTIALPFFAMLREEQVDRVKKGLLDAIAAGGG
jgi:perosamine synthetase